MFHNVSSLSSLNKFTFKWASLCSLLYTIANLKSLKHVHTLYYVADHKLQITQN